MKAAKMLLAMLLVAAVLQVGAATGSNSNRPLKDTITIGHWEEPSSLDPQTNGKLACFIVEIQIFNTLVHEDADGVITPSLAASWDIIDDTTIRFHLRDNVYFHNGDKLNAEDVKFTINRATTDPGSSSTFKSFDAVKTKVVDELTIDVKLKEAFASVFETLATPRGSIISKKAYEKMGAAAYARNPIGTGPYKMAEWITGTEISLVRNEKYWGIPAKTKNISYMFISESANRLIELETGGVDIIYNVLASDAPRLRKTEGITLLMGPSYQYNTITFNMQDPVLADQRVRDALTLAINKSSIVDALYDETATVAVGIMPSKTFGATVYSPSAYDVKTAKKLIADAGYANGLKLNFVVQPLEELTRITEAVQNMWKEIGVTTKIFTSELAPYLAQGNKLQVGIRNGSSSDPANTLIIYDSSFGDRLNSNNKKLDGMLAKAKTLYNDKERKLAYKEVQDYLWSARWSIPIAFKNNILATSDKVEGFAFHPLSWEELAYVTVYAK